MKENGKKEKHRAENGSHFHEHAEKMPIIDYHCHVNPKEIAENKCAFVV